MRFEWSSASGDLSIILMCSEFRCREIIRFFLSALNAITVGWSEEYMIDVDISRLLPPIAQPELVYGGFLHTYRAYCVRFSVRPDPLLIAYVESLPENDTSCMQPRPS